MNKTNPNGKSTFDLVDVVIMTKRQEIEGKATIAPHWYDDKYRDGWNIILTIKEKNESI